MIELPEAFRQKMKNLLQDEYDDFINSYRAEQNYGLRVNTLKITPEMFAQLNVFSLTDIPWAEYGFYYDPHERPGKHPYHDAGLYYIQEPSAMAVVEIMQPKPGEKILDLSAAPGGKATQIAQHMKQQGLLVANEIHPKRARVLSQNVERLGIKNCVVTNETPTKLAIRFPAFFDRILVDAPCSGEGMFRKNEEAIQEWSLDNVRQCAVRQHDILDDAKEMLAAGGQLVYSTCTFAPEENEQMINDFVKNNPEFTIEAVEVYEKFSAGRSEWVNEPVDDIKNTIRIWPHRVKGEGHFVAVLRKNNDEHPQRLKPIRALKNKKRLADFIDFAKDTLVKIPDGNYVIFGDELYLVPSEMIAIDRLKVLRPGWHLGTFKKNRFEPSHALALGLQKEEVKRTWNLHHDGDEVIAYLKGETIQASGEKGWYLITVDGYSLGWGKLTNKTMKNHYPKGLRWLGV